MTLKQRNSKVGGLGLSWKTFVVCYSVFSWANKNFLFWIAVKWLWNRVSCTCFRFSRISNKHVINGVMFSVHTDPRFLPTIYGLSSRNLPYRPRTRLIRGVYWQYSSNINKQEINQSVNLSNNHNHNLIIQQLLTIVNPTVDGIRLVSVPKTVFCSWLLPSIGQAWNNRLLLCK